jgi:hypothetical protein
MAVNTVLAEKARPNKRGWNLKQYHWKKGQSGNAKGRLPGSRNKLQEDFFESLVKAWTKYGDAALMAAAMTTPTDFVRIVAALMPRDVEVSVTSNMKLERMSTVELRTLIREYRGGVGDRLEASRAENGVFQVGETVRSDTGEASSPADEQTDPSKPR